MAKQKHYNEIYKIIEKYDPIGIAWVAKDEYETEAIEIANRAYVLDELALENYIYEVFSFWFTKSTVPSPKYTDIYKKMAEEIKQLFAEEEKDFHQ